MVKRQGASPLDSVKDWRQAHFSGTLCLQKAPWIDSREINLVVAPNIDSMAVSILKSGIELLVDDLGLDFKVVELPQVNPFKEIILKHPEISREYDIGILRRELSKYEKICKVASRYEYQPPGLVVILDGHFKGYSNLWGIGDYDSGTIFFAVPRERQNSHDFLKRISKHEASHLFGYGRHHDSFRVNGYETVQTCNTLSSAPTLNTCQKCKDALVYQWLGLQTRHNERYFKQP